MTWEVRSGHRWDMKEHMCTVCFMQCQPVLGKHAYLMYVCKKQMAG